MGETATLSQMTVAQLAERLASRDPVPGGGSAAAVAGAMAAGLVAMVVELSLGRSGSQEDEVALSEIGVAARERMAGLLALAESDSAAYQAVVVARRLPKESDGERATRTAAVQAATLGAARVPLQTAVQAVDVAALAARVAPIGNRNAVSDAGVAAHLAAAAVGGALLNVRINLPYLPPDEPLRAAAPAEMERLERAATQAADAAAAAVARRMETA